MVMVSVGIGLSSYGNGSSWKRMGHEINVVNDSVPEYIHVLVYYNQSTGYHGHLQSPLTTSLQ
jgi:hypothetical protein